jgi:nucleotide-binding universal stress UspA family protein
MIPQIKRILYTTDLSDNSSFVFRYAINSAKKHDATIIILHVLEPSSATTNAIVHPYLTEGQEKKISEDKIAYVKDRIKKRLKVFCEKELNNDPDNVDRVESIELCEGFHGDKKSRKILPD